jgi:hypothetical protein
VQALQRAHLRQVDLDDDLVGQDREAGAVADRGGGHDGAAVGDAHRLDDGDVHRLHLAGAQHLDGFGQVLVDVHHLAAVDRRAQHRVDLEGHAPRQRVGFGEQAVGVVAERGAGEQGDAQRFAPCAFGQRGRHQLDVASAGKAAHADGHAVADQRRSRGCAGDAFAQQRTADAFFVCFDVHGSVLPWRCGKAPGCGRVSAASN